MLSAGQLDRQVQFKRRVAVPSTVGAQRGGFENAGVPVWGSLVYGMPLRLALGDFHGTVPTGTLTVRADDVSAPVSAAYQVVVDGEVFEVRSVARSRDGAAVMQVVGADGRTVYAQEFDLNGEVVVVRRVVSNAPAVEANARARVLGYKVDEVVAGVAQGSRRILLSAADLEDAGWPVPPKRLDRVVVRGRPLTITDVDDSTHLMGGELMAYQIEAAG